MTKKRITRAEAEDLHVPVDDFFGMDFDSSTYRMPLEVLLEEQEEERARERIIFPEDFEEENRKQDEKLEKELERRRRAKEEAEFKEAAQEDKRARDPQTGLRPGESYEFGGPWKREWDEKKPSITIKSQFDKKPAGFDKPLTPQAGLSDMTKGDDENEIHTRQRPQAERKRVLVRVRDDK